MFEELSLPLPQLSQTTATEVDLPAIVEIHAATLFRVAHAVLRDRAESEDAVQDTFVRVLQHRQKLFAIRDLRPWLIRITWNLAMDRCRAHRRTVPEQADEITLESVASRSTPADQAMLESQQTQRVLQAIDRLPTAERQVLLLSALEELSTAEIAHIMNKSDSAIRALLHRARTHLRERLQDHPQKAGKR